MNINANMSAMQQKYSLPQSDPGSAFAMNQSSVNKVRPYSAVNRSTKGNAMTWDNPQMGGSSFMKFDDNQNTVAPSSLKE
jgi:hypothetical protein